MTRDGFGDAHPAAQEPQEEFWQPERGRRRQPRHRGRRTLHHRRPLGLGQDDVDPHAGRHGQAHGRRHPAQGQAHQRRARQQAPDLHGLPVPGALPPHERRRERRVLGQVQGHAEEGAPAARRRVSEARPPATELLRQGGDPVLGRRASARGAGQGAGLQPGDPLLRRAAFRDRLSAPQDAGEGAQGHPARDGEDLRLHHPQPRGGDGDVRPHRRYARRQARAGGQPRDHLHQAGEPLRYRVHGRGELDSGESRR